MVGEEKRWHSRPFVRVWRERNVMFFGGRESNANVNGLIGLGVVVKTATVPRNNVGGSGWDLRTQFVLTRSKLNLFRKIKHFPSVLIEGNRWVGF